MDDNEEPRVSIEGLSPTAGGSFRASSRDCSSGIFSSLSVSRIDSLSFVILSGMFKESYCEIVRAHSWNCRSTVKRYDLYINWAVGLSWPWRNVKGAVQSLAPFSDAKCKYKSAVHHALSIKKSDKCESKRAMLGHWLNRTASKTLPHYTKNVAAS